MTRYGYSYEISGVNKYGNERDEDTFNKNRVSTNAL